MKKNFWFKLQKQIHHLNHFHCFMTIRFHSFNMFSKALSVIDGKYKFWKLYTKNEKEFEALPTN
jgi:hypothetical protein